MRKNGKTIIALFIEIKMGTVIIKNPSTHMLIVTVCAVLENITAISFRIFFQKECPVTKDTEGCHRSLKPLKVGILRGENQG